MEDDKQFKIDLNASPSVRSLISFMSAKRAATLLNTTVSAMYNLSSRNNTFPERYSVLLKFAVENETMLREEENARRIFNIRHRGLI